MRKLLAILLLSLPLLGAERPTVKVTFPFNQDQPYGRRFTPDEQKLITGKVQKDVRETLDKALPPFDFLHPDTAMHELRIVLKSDPNATPNNRAINFELSMDPDVHPLDSTWPILFRPPEHASDPIVSREAFEAELSNKLCSYLQTNAQLVVTKLFRRVPLAAKAFAVPTQTVFVLPFSASEWKMGENTRFAISTLDAAGLDCKFTAKLAGGAPAGAGVPAEYRSGLSARAFESDPAAAVGQFAAGTKTYKAREVNLLDYDRFDPPAPTPPSGFVPGSGGHP